MLFMIRRVSQKGINIHSPIILSNKRFIRSRRVLQGLGKKLIMDRSMDDDDVENVKKRVLILGSSGVLGSSLVQTLKRDNVWILGVDIVPPQSTQKQPDLFVHLNSDIHTRLPNMIQNVKTGIDHMYNKDENGPLILDAIICASGGFTMDSTEPEEMGIIHEDMMKKNFYPIVAAGEIAKDYMTLQNGLFVIMGAVSALSGATPGMSAYGCSKAAAHHYIQTLGSLTGETLSGQNKEKRKSDAVVQTQLQYPYLKQLTALGVLPTIIDTPSNRTAMPQANFDAWTKPNDIAKEISTWLRVPELRPHSGSLIKIVTKKDGEGQYISEFHLVR